MMGPRTRGPWSSALQLPHKYIPGIAARPWHSAESFPQLQPLLDLLREAAPALRKEYRKLKRKGLLLSDEDCIQRDAGGKSTISSNWSLTAGTPKMDPLLGSSANRRMIR